MESTKGFFSWLNGENSPKNETGQILPGINGSCTSLGCGACNREPRFPEEKHHVFFFGGYPPGN